MYQQHVHVVIGSRICQPRICFHSTDDGAETFGTMMFFTFVSSIASFLIFERKTFSSLCIPCQYELFLSFLNTSHFIIRLFRWLSLYHKTTSSKLSASLEHWMHSHTSNFVKKYETLHLCLLPSSERVTRCLLWYSLQSSGCSQFRRNRLTWHFILGDFNAKHSIWDSQTNTDPTVSVATRLRSLTMCKRTDSLLAA